MNAPPSQLSVSITRSRDGRGCHRVTDPSPKPGLALADFRKIGGNGLGDAGNAYAHSMVWYRDRLHAGTTRNNLCMLRVSKIQTRIAQWPVECPDNLYDLDMRAQIWRYDPRDGRWQMVIRSPMIEATDGTRVPRELGYRCMTVFQGETDTEPTLYAATYASAKGRGTQILRSEDGLHFSTVAKPAEFGEFVTTLRLLVPFKGRLFTAPTGRAQGNPNAAGLTVVYETRDPKGGAWVPACQPNFGDPGNLSVFEMVASEDHLYAGTANLEGFQVWRTKADGDPPYTWERIIHRGAYRGATNQAVASFCVFKNAVYVGTGIQHGGIDRANKVGPAPPELIRIHPDGSWDLIVGMPRVTPEGRKEPLSGYGAGFGNFFNGYFWRMGVFDDWMYLGTFDWSLMLCYSKQDGWPEMFRRVFSKLDMDSIRDGLAGADLYRSFDGENWLPVTTDGFGNPYNYGIRTIVPTPIGLVVGTVNPFGPRVARRTGDGWTYEDNPDGGFEVWLGRHREER